MENKNVLSSLLKLTMLGDCFKEVGRLFIGAVFDAAAATRFITVCWFYVQQDV